MTIIGEYPVMRKPFCNFVVGRQLFQESAVDLDCIVRPASVLT